MNASVFRNTKFEIRELHQGPNSFGVVCTERSTRGRVAPLEIPEELLDDAEMAQVHAVLGMLEKKFEIVHDAYLSDPARLQDLLVEARLAEEATRAAKLETRRLELAQAEKAAKLAELDTQIAEREAKIAAKK